MRGNSKEKWEKQRAKVEHKIAKVNNPVLFEEKRVELAGYLMNSLIQNTPNWGTLRVKFARTI